MDFGLLLPWGNTESRACLPFKLSFDDLPSPIDLTFSFFFRFLVFSCCLMLLLLVDRTSFTSSSDPSESRISCAGMVPSWDERGTDYLFKDLTRLTLL